MSAASYRAPNAEGNCKLVLSEAFAPGQHVIKQINADQMTLRNLYEQAGRPIKRKEEHRVSISLHMDRSKYYRGMGAKEPEPEEKRGIPDASAQDMPLPATSPPATFPPPHAATTKTPVPPAPAEESIAAPKAIPAARTPAETKPPAAPKPKSKPEPAKKAPKRIGLHAFSVCSSLGRITIPESMTDIEGFSFDESWKLKEIHGPERILKKLYREADAALLFKQPKRYHAFYSEEIIRKIFMNSEKPAKNKQAVSCTAVLLERKRERSGDMDPMDAFVLEE